MSSSKSTKLGNSKLEVSRLGLGCMGMSEFYGSVDDKESIKTIHRAYELGVNHFDTADMYGMGHNELLLSKAIKSLKRDSIVVATKCGFIRNETSGQILGLNCTPKHIKKSCEDSLKRLGVDYIDLFYLHRESPTTPIEAGMQALSELVQEGKILNVGLCAVGPDTIKRAHSVYPLTAIQSEYSILTRDPEKDVLPLCKELNIGFVAYFPIGSGFLTGKIKSINGLADNDMRRMFPRLQEENISHNLTIVKAIEDLANKKHCTVAQVALAWLLAQGDNIVAIPGTRRITHLEENMRANDVTLSNEEILQLSNQIPFKFAKGSRIPEEWSKVLNNYEVQ